MHCMDPFYGDAWLFLDEFLHCISTSISINRVRYIMIIHLDYDDVDGPQIAVRSFEEVCRIFRHACHHGDLNTVKEVFHWYSGTEDEQLRLLQYRDLVSFDNGLYIIFQFIIIGSNAAFFSDGLYGFTSCGRK
jgi:hypothetical protein